jgi:hypothetical protein
MIYKHTAKEAKDKHKTVWALGRNDTDHGKQPIEGGYSVWVRQANNNQRAGGDGLQYTWRKFAPKYSPKKTGLSYVDAVKMMNKKLKRKEFIEELPK